MATDIYIGIDPGLQGAIVSLTRGGDVLEIHQMPVIGNEMAILEIRDILSSHTMYNACVVLEKVSGRPGQGGGAMFNFGCGWGMIRAICTMMGITTHLVMPPRWKKTVLDGYSHDKEGAIKYCASRWPTTNLILPGKRTAHDGIADALCIAEYGRITGL